jgi:hypothetical protein
VPPFAFGYARFGVFQVRLLSRVRPSLLVGELELLRTRSVLPGPPVSSSPSIPDLRRFLYCRERSRSLAVSGLLLRRPSAEDVSRYGALLRESLTGRKVHGNVADKKSLTDAAVAGLPNLAAVSVAFVAVHPGRLCYLCGFFGLVAFWLLLVLLAMTKPSYLRAFYIVGFGEAGQLLKLVWRTWIAGVCGCWVVARGGRAVEVGPLRLLVVLPG